MLDIKLIRENPDSIKKGITAKNNDPKLVDKVLELDEKRRKLLGSIETLRARRNTLGKEDVDTGKEIKNKLKEMEPDLKNTEQLLNDTLLQIPNLPASDVKPGKDESGNEIIKKWGEPTKLDFQAKDHLTLGTSLGILDFETGAKVTGSQFYFLYGDGAILELALVRFALDLLIKEGFTPVITPDLVRSRYYLGTGYAPQGNEAQTYTINNSDLGLIATAEITLAGKHADEVIPENKLPLKYAGYSHCFRQEAGAYGKYSKGLYRVHEFTKVEMFIYTKPEDSDKLHDYLLQMEEKIYQELKLPYRVVKMCSGDLGAMAARKYDIEVWMPGRGEYGEVTSTSNCTDYQARNLNIKFRSKEGKNEFVHMLNGTAIATSRTLIAILENYQQKDGSVKIPDSLQKYVGKKEIKK